MTSGMTSGMTLSPRDLASLRLVGSPTLAPDGSRAVAVVQSVDPDALTKRTELWSFPFDGAPEALGERSHPAFSPGGELFTVDSAAEPVAGGTVVGAGWLDDERVVAVVERAAPADEPIVLDWLRFKHDGGPSFVEPTHELWLLGDEPRLLRELDGRVTSLAVGGGAVVYAMVERHSDVPTAPVQVRRWTFDGDELLWACPAQVAGLAVTSLSGTVVVSSSAVAGHSAAPAHLWVVDGGEPRPLFADLECERSILGDSRPAGKPAVVRSVAGTDDVVFLATVGHDVGLFAGSVDGGTARRLTPEGCTVTDLSAAHDGRVAVCVESPTAPVELFVVSLDGDVKQVSRFNSVAAVAPETVTVGDLRGLLLRANGDGPGPLVVRVHGGPHLAWGTSFNVDDQVLVSAGFHVLLPNPSGSAGRGAEFRARTVGQWGKRDYDELMAFVDHVVDAGIADPAQLYLMGGSYGGFLINWTVTRTNRFRAVVSERSISNFLSKFGTSDNGYTTNRYELGGSDVLDDGVLELLERSPLRHAAAITTPMLLIHGEDDYRCPIEQSEQLFVALRRLGVESRFVRFPGESHGLATGGRPGNRIARLELILDWLIDHRERAAAGGVG